MQDPQSAPLPVQVFPYTAPSKPAQKMFTFGTPLLGQGPGPLDSSLPLALIVPLFAQKHRT